MTVLMKVVLICNFICIVSFGVSLVALFATAHRYEPFEDPWFGRMLASEIACFMFIAVRRILKDTK